MEDRLKQVREEYFKFRSTQPPNSTSVVSFVAGWNARVEVEKNSTIPDEGQGEVLVQT